MLLEILGGQGQWSNGSYTAGMKNNSAPVVVTMNQRDKVEWAGEDKWEENEWTHSPGSYQKFGAKCAG